MKTHFVMIAILITVLDLTYTLANEIDSIKLKVSPDSISNNASDSIISWQITNESSDSLLMIAEVYIKGLNSTDIVYPLSSYYCPNLLFLFPNDNSSDIGDGIYNINYEKIPPTFSIPPRSKRTIKLNLKNFEYLLLDKKWKTKGLINLAHKSTLDSIIRNIFPDKISSYQSSIIITDDLVITPQLSDVIKNKSAYEWKNRSGTFNQIQKAFNLRIVK
jgi:hypothetical protein